MPARTMRCGAGPVTSRPSSSTVPACALTSPAAARSVLVFPAPLAPSTRVTRPGVAERVTPRTASAVAYRTCRSAISSTVPPLPQIGLVDRRVPDDVARGTLGDREAAAHRPHPGAGAAPA